MSRLIVTDSAATVGPTSSQPESKDDFLARVAKYVPAEIVGVYLFLQGGIVAIADPTIRVVVFGLVTLGLAIFVPFYLNTTATREQRKLRLAEKPKWRTQAIVSVVAFVIWVYAVGAAGVLGVAYQPIVASIVLAFFSLAVGKIIPRT